MIAVRVVSGSVFRIQCQYSGSCADISVVRVEAAIPKLIIEVMGWYVILGENGYACGRLSFGKEKKRKMGW